MGAFRGLCVSLVGRNLLLRWMSGFSEYVGSLYDIIGFAGELNFLVMRWDIIFELLLCNFLGARTNMLDDACFVDVLYLLKYLLSQPYHLKDIY